MTRQPFFAAMERPGRSGRVARQSGPTHDDQQRWLLEVQAVRDREDREYAAAQKSKPATVLDTVAEAMGDQL